ncbi:MAG: hypothetical protein O9262_12700, partial [Cyclobacteriaceae bacterium]|nr:hypothetical protein [Cyclobacteriaceae bacterium]
ILQKLNLVDHKKDSVAEFDERLTNYIDRNKNLRVVLQFDRNKLEKDLEFNLSLINRVDQPYPDNFEMGNPHNRWLFDPIVKTEEQMEKEKLEFQKMFQDKLVELNDFLDKVKKLGKGQIDIIDR